MNITKAGWATNSNGRGIEPQNVSLENHEICYNDLVDWTDSKGILTILFEAFDDSLKVGSETLEPEKHQRLFEPDRSPKFSMEGKPAVKIN